MTPIDIWFVLWCGIILIPSYAEMFKDVEFQQFRNTLPPDTRFFDTFSTVWCDKKKFVVVNYAGDYLWLHELESLKNPIKVDSRLVKWVFRTQIGG